eukprot:TRINITY_DN11317_c0_g1_i2.p1 TRINITY_DN11317_c0_g1~~TRINITY_DN11317_c0_g1_i2.p1  ORF type:complete len:183 (+),score=20.46 TRINITY_DN11317_c0_g1_i2:359-907(+)
MYTVTQIKTPTIWTSASSTSRALRRNRGQLSSGAASVSALQWFETEFPGGRLDQELSNLNALYRWAPCVTIDQLAVVGPEGLAVLLPANQVCEIHPNHTLETGVCGLLPLGAPARSVHTTGLKWDLNGSPLEFGGMVSVAQGGLRLQQVSSSNQVAEDCVSVETDSPLIWNSSFSRYVDNVR